MNSAQPLPLQQHPSFAAALRMLGQPAEMRDMGNATVLTLKRFGMSCASRGPVWHEQTPPCEKTSKLRQTGLRLLNADRHDPTAYRNAGFRLINTAASVAELDLNGSPQDLIARAHGKWRNIWRRGRNSPLTFTQDRFDPRKHHWIFDADAAQQRQKQYRALPHTLVQAYAANRRKDVIVYLAHHKQEPVAAMLFLLHSPVATYHLGWANDVGRQNGAHHHMIMNAACDLGTWGFTRLDLGTVDTDTTPGIARFKIGTGAMIRPLGGTWLKLPGL